MDFEIIVWLVIIFFFILSRFLSRKPKPEQRPQPSQRRQTDAAEAQHDASLEDALREIREALGGASHEKERPAPKPQPKPQQRPTTLSQRPAEAKREHEGTFHDTVLVDRSRAQRPQQPPQKPPQRSAPAPGRAGGAQSVQAKQAALLDRLKDKELGDTPVIDEIMRAYDRGHHVERGVRKDDIMPMLSSRQALKQAMKLREVLGPCRAKEPYAPDKR